MEGETLLVYRNQSWDYAFRARRDRSRLWLPSGVFLARKNAEYHPTTHSVGRAEFYGRQLEPCLLRETSVLGSPLTVTVSGRGSCILTNTGRYPLKIGQSFVVCYPTQEDVDAQTACVTMPHTMEAHPNIKDSEPLWGGLLATVGRDRMWDVVEAAVLDEVNAGNAGTLYHVGKLMHACQAEAHRYPQLYYDSVQNGADDRQNIVNAMQANPQAMVRIIKCAYETAQKYTPRVSGIVQQSLMGSSDTVKTGEKFHATIVFEP